MKNLGTEVIIRKFFGFIDRWPTEDPTGRNFTQDQIRKVCQHINDTGDCLWHAQHVVLGSNTCHCAKCTPSKAVN